MKTYGDMPQAPKTIVKSWMLKERDLSSAGGNDKALWLWHETLGWVAEFQCTKTVAMSIVGMLTLTESWYELALKRAQHSKTSQGVTSQEPAKSEICDITGAKIEPNV